MTETVHDPLPVANSALYYTALHCTVLYCTILHYTVLYCTVLYLGGGVEAGGELLPGQHPRLPGPRHAVGGQSLVQPPRTLVIGYINTL